MRCRMIYDMCTQKPPNDYSEQLYNRYKDTFTVYISETVLSLRHEPPAVWASVARAKTQHFPCTPLSCCAGRRAPLSL